MSISCKVSQDIQFLQNLDPAHFSIEQEGINLKKINKRSCLSNFFHWVIHLLTLTLVPQNRALDCVTRAILKEIRDELKNVTEAEKELVKKAIHNLKLVIKNNGGSQGHAVNKMLATLAKIQSLPAVQNLVEQRHDQEDDLIEVEVENRGQEDSELVDEMAQEDEAVNDTAQEDEVEDASQKENQVKALPMIISDSQETRLRDLLQDLLKQNVLDYKAAESIGALLPKLEGSVPLSNDLLAVLGNAFEKMKAKTLSENLSPGLLVCLVKNSFENANLIGLFSILAITDKRTLTKEQIKAFAYGLKLYQDDTLKADTPPKEIPPDQLKKLMLSFKNRELLIVSFKDHLSEDEMKDFIRILLELVVAQTSNDDQERIENYETAFCLRNTVGKQHVQLVLEILCQVKNVKLLAKIFRYEGTRDLAIESILNAHPPKADDPDDHFFQDFLKELIGEYKEEVESQQLRSLTESLNAITYEKYAKSIAQYVFTHACTKRQEILASKLPSPLLALHLEQVPTQTWKDIPDSILLNVAWKLSYQNLAPTQTALKAFAQGLNADRLYDLITQDKMRRHFWGSLLPLCEFNTQVQFVSKIIDSYSYHHHSSIEKIQLDLKVWEEASKQNLTRKYQDMFSWEENPEIFAHIINGQINNHQFLQDFFMFYFDKNNKDLEHRKTCVAHLKPEVFEFNDPEKFQHPTWYTLFKTLRELPDQQHAQTLLIRSTLHLFNHPAFYWVQRECVYALTREQMELLPIQEYKRPEIRLLLACLTQRLDDQLLETANSLYDQQGGTFFNFFEQAYSRSDETPAQLESFYCFAFKKDTQYLKDFLLWVLDRPSLTPTLRTWSWINSEIYAQDILLRQDIQGDADIQAHIRRLHLTVLKPKRGW